jgi:hypothetical protein
MKKTTFALLFFLGAGLSLVAQTLVPVVTSASGGYYENGNFTFSLTSGEPTLVTLSNDSTIITPGFQQPFPVPLQQTIPLPAGWWGISSYLIPVDPLIVNIFDPVVNSLIIVNTFDGKVYWPALNINNIINWDTHTGYRIKMSAAAQLVITGFLETNRTIDLLAGWNVIPLLSATNVNTATLFAPLGDTLIIVKEIAGGGIYWPALGVNSLPYLYPGNAYYIKVTADCSYSYSESRGNATSQPQPKPPVNTSPWNDVILTPMSHSVAVNSRALELLETGDILGAFNDQGICTGMFTVEQRENHDAVAVFGDDVTTSGLKDGMAEGEEIIWRLYRPSTGETYDATVFYDAGLPNKGMFATNGLSKIDRIILTITSMEEQDRTWLSVYPNPGHEQLTIEVIGKLKENTILEIWSLQGQIIYQQSLTENKTAINLTGTGQGIYIVKVIDPDQVQIRKILRQ